MTETNTKQRLRLYLIRHGEVEGATSGKLLGRTDTPLSERGLEQSRQLAEVLSTAQLSAVYSSDLQRARMTAETIAKQCELQIQVSAAWREIDMGEWEGRTIAALHDDAPLRIGQLFENPASFKYPGGESFADFTARVRGGIDQLLTIHTSGNVALVVHGGVCRAIIGTMLGVPMRNWLRLAQEYGCLNVAEWYDGNPVLVSLNSRAVIVTSEVRVE
jgi:alpha-ribazole phosphatase